MMLGHRSACALAAKQRQAVSHLLFAVARPHVALLLCNLHKVPVFCRVQVKVKAHLSDLLLFRYEHTAASTCQQHSTKPAAP